MVTFSLCMIVKDEADILKRCLDSIQMLMDEIIIVDTGSTDNTRKIAAAYTSQVYDFKWDNDFAAARNFAFSKATMDYIYSADADEIINPINRNRFLELKQTLIPEIEIVQMYCLTPPEFNTCSNRTKKYRPKLYKRLRSFIWVDAVHESVRLEPLVFDSNIEIYHMPRCLHSKRDFKLFNMTFSREGFLSPNLHSMYAKELFISGNDEDFINASNVFDATLAAQTSTNGMIQEAICILSHIERLQKHIDVFFSLAFKLIYESTCSEICYEVGLHFQEKRDFHEAINWYEKAATETSPILDVRRGGSMPKSAIAQCYRCLAEAIKNTSPKDRELVNTYLAAAASNETEAAELERHSF